MKTGSDRWLPITTTAPSRNGIYPVIYSYDAHEGFMPSASEWRDGKWIESNAPLLAYWREPAYPTHHEAADEAYMHDIEDTKP